MKIVFLFYFAFAMLTQSAAQTRMSEIENANLLHRAEKALTDVIVHDIFSPPVASRIYAYANIAAYEVLVKGNDSCVSLKGLIPHFPAIVEPEKEISYPLAAVYSFLLTGKKLVFSEPSMQDSIDAILKILRNKMRPALYNASLDYGTLVSNAIITWAGTDHYPETRKLKRYDFKKQEGRWIPTPPAYMAAVEPYWNKIRPLLLDSASQFKPEAPDLFSKDNGSSFYKMAHEVYQTGKELNNEQKNIANFWDCNPFFLNTDGHLNFATKKISPGGHWISITGILCRKFNTSMMKAAAAYTFLSIAMFDSFISCWDEKYRSNLIRPETYINSNIDESWRPLLQTPPFPEYPSGHSVVSAASAVVLSRIFGNKVSYSDDSEIEFGLPARNFNTIEDASKEAAISRLYGGIHYMPAIENGMEQGKSIGQLVVGKVIDRALPFTARAQSDTQPVSSKYEWPEDPSVRAKLDQWQDLKFGMIIHWGLYAVPGIVESWALCSEDWIERDSTMTYDQFKKWYWDLKNELNPDKFDPDAWAKAAEDAGMKYVVFTTKHHDGFCMFDTKETDFKISNGPFRNNPKADVAKFVFEAFRKKGFMIGAYFSKPDWHSEYYWWPKYATPDRNNNYDIRKYPERWNRYKDFTYNQIKELTQNYGPIDILWLDGGWVRPLETVNEEVRSWDARIPQWSQDIDIPRIAAMARKAQPGLLIVDRTVHGPFENYQTPEQRIPAKQLDNPWESCMTLGNGWGYVPNEHFKSANQVIHSLIEIVAKGGSLLLGVGPQADGALQPEAVNRMKEIGLWLKGNGEAIYNTRTTRNYVDSNTYFTVNKRGNLKYAMFCLDENAGLPSFFEWKGNSPIKGSKMVYLPTGVKVKWKEVNGMTRVFLPASILKDAKNNAALAFSFEPADK